MSGRPGVDEDTYLGAIRLIGFLLIVLCIGEFYSTQNTTLIPIALGILALMIIAGKLKQEALKAGEIRAITNE